MSNIINPEHKPQAPSHRLTRDQFQKIAYSYGRLLDLKETKIQNANHEAEIKGLVEFLAEEFLAHAPEFLGVWSAVRDEYEPLMNLLATIHDRVKSISQMRQALTAVATPENIVKIQ